MKSPFSNSTGNCVDVAMTRDGEHVRVTDTKGKTGDVELLFTHDEWEAFVKGCVAGAFAWDKIPLDVTDDRPITPREKKALLAKFEQTGMARTPENMAYVNGRHAERAGWVHYSYTMFCKKFHLSENDRKSVTCYDAFQTGRRAEAHENTSV